MQYPVQVIKPIEGLTYEDNKYIIYCEDTRSIAWARGACYLHNGSYAVVIVFKAAANLKFPYGLFETVVSREEDEASTEPRALYEDNFARYTGEAAIYSHKRDPIARRIITELLAEPETKQEPGQLDALDL